MDWIRDFDGHMPPTSAPLIQRHDAPKLPATQLCAVMTQPSTITIQIPGVLRARCAGASTLQVAAPNVRAVLGEIERLHPSLYQSVCDETGAVRRHVNLFVNTSHVRDREGLDTTLLPGDIVTILPAVSGG